MSQTVVRLLGIPVREWLRLQEHTDALLREYRLMIQQGTTRVPAELAELFDAARAEFPQSAVPGFRGGMKGAFDEGRPTADVEAAVTAGQADRMAALHDHLARIDDYCRSGVLLTLPLEQELLDLRGWIVEEVCRQVEGHEPRRYPGPAGG